MDLLTKALTEASIKQYIKDEGLKGEKGDKGDPGDVSIAQLNDLKENLSDSVADLKSANYLLDKSLDDTIGRRLLFDRRKTVSGRLTTTGSLYYNAEETPAHFTSDYIPVYAGMVIESSCSWTDYHHRLAEYGSDKAFIRLFTATTDRSIIIPSDVSYIRFCAYESERNTLTFITPKVNNNYLVYGAKNGKVLIDGTFMLGNIGASGAIDSSYTNRVATYNYLKYDSPVIVNIDYPYICILCLYNTDYSLRERTVYANTRQFVIPSDTFFRICIYNSKDDAAITNMRPFIEAVYIMDFCNNYTNLIAVYESFAVIGDSLSCGFVGTSNGRNYSSNEARMAKRNWPSYLELAINRPFTNLARGSSTAHDWRYGNSELDVNIAAANIDTYCYMIWLGVNDARNSLSIGTLDDIKTDRTNNSDTFYGNYDYVIRQVKSYIDNRITQAQIFVFTIPPTETNAEEYNTAIRHIASLYDYVNCIDLYNLYYTEFLNPPFSGTWIYGHSRPIGYAIIADMIRKGVNLYMWVTYNKFLFDPWPTL